MPKKSLREFASFRSPTAIASIDLAPLAPARVPRPLVRMRRFSTPQWRSAAAHDARRCHCGDFIASIDNVNNRDAGSWKWCAKCGARKFCRTNDRCPARADVVEQSATWVARVGLDVPLAVLACVGTIALLLLSGPHRATLVLAVATLASVAEVVLSYSRSSSAQWLSRWKLGFNTRALIRAALVATAFVADGAAATLALLPAVLGAVVAMQLGRTLSTEARAAVRLRSKNRVAWSNLPGSRTDSGIVRQPIHAARLVTATEAPLWGGLAIAVRHGGGPVAWIVAAVVVLLIIGVVALVFATAALRLRRIVPDDAAAAAVLEGVESAQPVILVSVAANPESPDLDRVAARLTDESPVPALLVLREASRFERQPHGRRPAVLLPRAIDTDLLEHDSIDLVLHIGHSNKNNQILRLGRMVQCLIDPGVETVRPVARMYDEVWVTSSKRRDEYLAMDEGFEANRVLVIPALRELLEEQHRPARTKPAAPSDELRLALTAARFRAMRIQQERSDSAQDLQLTS